MTQPKQWMIVLAATLACLDWGRGGISADSATIEASEDTATNVVLITISSLRADHVSGLGCERCTTPEFDRFARQGTLFRRAFAGSGWMMPAHGSIFTSLYPSDHGATHIDRRLDERCQTLAEILAGQGYCCAGFCCAPRLDRERGFAQGFHLYDDYSVSMILEGLECESEGTLDINLRRTNDLINDAAISWLRNNTHKPFFLFLHYYDNHWDYLPPPPYRDMYDPNYRGPIDGTRIAREPLYSNVPAEQDIEHMVALYDGEVRQTDSDLGEMLDALEERGLFDNSIILVLGDHGEQFYEHGNTSHHGLYDELIHVPLAISFPDEKKRGKVVDALVSQFDVLPTVLDCLGVSVPAACRGRSLRPLLDGQVEAIHPYVYAEYAGGAVPDVFAVRSHHHKCFRTGDGRTFAYDLLIDPGEQRQIASKDFTADVKSLAAALDDLMPARPAEFVDANH